jgi:hypothetical protein
VTKQLPHNGREFEYRQEWNMSASRAKAS